MRPLHIGVAADSAAIPVLLGDSDLGGGLSDGSALIWLLGIRGGKEAVILENRKRRE